MALNRTLVKRSLDAHSAIGLVVGALMYLVCLTGTLAAIAETFERWEQPDIPEFTSLPDQAIDSAIAQFQALLEIQPDTIWVVFPTQEWPRAHVAGDDVERFIDANGNLLQPPREGWTHMLRELHISLHLPHNVGLVIVSTIGAMLLALIVSGLLSHPRLFRDAFTFRLGGSRRLEQADIHNRLSVWGLPFHLMIATTGAFYGLVGLLVLSAATAWYDGDTTAVFEAVYGGDPILEAPVRQPDASRAMLQLRKHRPDVTPIYLRANKLGTPAQFIEIAATVPGRLAYSEIYRFKADGSYLGSQELTTGPVARQFLYSLYRVHFGYFGGQFTRILWLVMGLALTLVTVSGINIWLAKRGRDDWVDRAWCALVWGSPLALATSAAGAVFFLLPSLPVFILLLSLVTLVSVRQRQVAKIKARLQAACSLGLMLLAVAHAIAYPWSQHGSYLLWLNCGLLATAGILGAMAWNARQQERAAMEFL